MRAILIPFSLVHQATSFATALRNTALFSQLKTGNEVFIIMDSDDRLIRPIYSSSCSTPRVSNERG